MKLSSPDLYLHTELGYQWLTKPLSLCPIEENTDLKVLTECNFGCMEVVYQKRAWW